MDVFVQGKQKVSLHQNDFKGKGGQGSVYVKGRTAYKVYTDPAAMIPIAKIGELAALTSPAIVKPEEILLDRGRTPVGYTMRGVPDAIPLCQTLTRAFRDRSDLTPDRMLGLVRRLQEGVAHVHAQGLLIVDLNENNFLVGSRFDEVYFIDVDSYQTPHFPATALMESVRDRHAKGFSTETDWFSFAIVSFQMFVGIHPYKGKHPTLPTLDDRMQANVSVLDSAVSLPAACLPFDVIPSVYRRWYRAVLDEGRRLPPPDRMDAIVIAPSPLPQRPIFGGSAFQIEELEEFGADVRNYVQGLVVTAQGVVIGGKSVLHPGVQIGRVPQTGHAVAAWADRGRVRFFDLHREADLVTDIAGEDVMAADGRLYVKNGESLLEIEFWPLPATTVVKPKLVAPVMAQATRLFEGGAVQNVLGAYYAVLLPSRGRAYPIRLPELDGAQVVEAKFQHRVLMVSTAKNGRYDKFILRFDASFQTYDLRRIEDVPTPGLNFVVLESGVCLHLNDRDELEVFSPRKDAPELKVIADPALKGDCRLFKNGTQALFARGRTLFKFSMGTP